MPHSNWQLLLSPLCQFWTGKLAYWILTSKRTKIDSWYICYWVIFHSCCCPHLIELHVCGSESSTHMSLLRILIATAYLNMHETLTFSFPPKLWPFLSLPFHFGCFPISDTNSTPDKYLQKHCSLASELPTLLWGSHKFLLCCLVNQSILLLWMRTRTWKPSGCFQSPTVFLLFDI